MYAIKLNETAKKRMCISLRRLLLMTTAVIMALATFTACDKDGNGTDPDTPSSYPEKAAIKYLDVSHLNEYGETEHYYLTFDNHAKRFRYDNYGAIRHIYTGEYISLYDHWHSEMVNHISKTHWKSIYNGECVDEPYNASQKIDQSFSTAKQLLSLGYKKLPAQKTYAGKPCDMYTHTNSYGTSTIGLWNDITLYREIETEISYSLSEALEVTLDVPEVAFTKTLDITWLTK